jgi:RimJ/RimL family protein N-acetyltransferase
LLSKLNTTDAPSRASRSTIARPIPREPPVTNAAVTGTTSERSPAVDVMPDMAASPHACEDDPLRRTAEREPRMTELTGHGLILREWSDEDLPALRDLFDDPDVAYRTPLPSPFDLEAARDYLADAGRSQRVQLAITTDGLQVRGEVRLNCITGGISYVVGAAHRGQRLAVRAVQLMTEHAHEALGLPRVILEIEPDNHPSVAVARAAGFRLTDAPPETVADKGRSLTLFTWARPAGNLHAPVSGG